MTEALVVFTEEEHKLIRETFAPGLSKQEFELFLYTAKALQLNPLKRQIYAVKRKQWDPETRSYMERMTIQTGIDGFRAVSFRNDRVLPGREPTFEYDQNPNADSNPAGLLSATAYLKMWGKDGQYHEVCATAYWDEYVPLKDGKPMAMWKKMPRTMLAKCAEALAHRRCSPELSGVYTSDEMQQADSAGDGGVHRVAQELPADPPTRSISGAEKEGASYRDVMGAFPEARLVGDAGAQGAVGVHNPDPEGSSPSPATKRKKRKGKFGFLDEMKELKGQVGDDAYYATLRATGPGYAHASEIENREDQVTAWKALKQSIPPKEETT